MRPVLVLLMCAATACSAPRSASPEKSPPTTAPPPSPTAQSPTTPREFTLAVAGDVHFTGRTAPLLKDPATAFGPITPLLREADLTLLNLETAVTDRGTPEPKEFHFRAPATAYEAVRAAGVDAVSLANNHVLDYGRVGLDDTLRAARAAGVPVFGAGKDAAEAYAPWVTEVRGTRVAVVGLSQITTLADSWAARDDRSGVALTFDETRVRAAVEKAKAQADVVIAFLHWGPEGDGCPSGRQKEFLPILISAGVDVVVGAHAHVLQGAGWSGRTFVAYGLGNFLWYGTSRSTETGILKLTLRGRDVIGWALVPAVISAAGQPVPVTGAQAGRVGERFAGLRGCAGLSAGPG